MTNTLIEKVAAFLESHPEEKFTHSEIAGQLIKLYPDHYQAKKERSRVVHTDAQLQKQVAGEIYSARREMANRYPCIKTIEDRPYRLYYTSQPDGEGISSGLEKTLYPLLRRYLYDEFGIHTMRIEESRSSNSRGRGGNKWLHPDIVGLETLSTHWHSEIQQCAELTGSPRSRLWSFEVKWEISRSSAREAFYQALVNSTWANLGYLVAVEIHTDAMEELRMLSAAYGIGLIRFNPEEVMNSQISIPTRERPTVDWNMANRLFHENSDFQLFITLVRHFYQTKGIDARQWGYSEAASA